jgi:hypothetical protein
MGMARESISQFPDLEAFASGARMFHRMHNVMLIAGIAVMLAKAVPLVSKPAGAPPITRT